MDAGEAGDEPALRLLGGDQCASLDRRQHEAVIGRRAEPAAAPGEPPAGNEFLDRRVNSHAQGRPVELDPGREIEPPAIDDHAARVGVPLGPAAGPDEPRPDALGRGGNEKLIDGVDRRLVSPRAVGELNGFHDDLLGSAMP